MQTTCPECRTTFRVSQQHLAIRRGLVRCGRCNAVFNAYDTLLPELAEPPVAASPEAADEASPYQKWLADAAADTTLPETLQVQALAGSTAELAATGELDEPPRLQALPDLPAALEAPETAESILLSQLPSRLPPVKTALPGWKIALYGLASLLLSGLLALQLAYFLRAELAAALPASRPLLTALCAPLGCQVPLPRQLTRQAISASALEHDPEQKSRIRLTFLLTNRSGQTQAWPHILLTLSDVRDRPVAQKVFPPASYLPEAIAATAGKTGMPAGSEREMRLELDVGNLVASGYALDLVYP